MKKFFLPERMWAWAVVALFFLVMSTALIGYKKILSDEQRQNASNAELDLFCFEQVLNSQIQASQQQVADMVGQVQRRGESVELFASKSASMLEGMTALTNIKWFDAHGVLRGKTTVVPKNVAQIEVTRNLSEDEAIVYARTRSAAVAVGPFLMNDGDYEITVVWPIFSDTNQLIGFVAGHYSLDLLFSRALPTWFSTKYYLNVYDENKSVYSTAQDEGMGFDTLSPIAQRETNISGVPLTMKVQLHPDSQIWVVSTLFLGLVFLLFLLLVSLIALIFDIRRRRRTEKQLSVQNSLHQAIEASLSVGIRGHSMDGTIIYVNPAFCQMIGYSADEMLNIPLPLPYIPKGEVHKIFAARDRLLDNSASEVMIELKMRKKNGELIDTIMRGGSMYGENNERIGWISSVEDVTMRKSLEAFQSNEQKRIETLNHLISMGEMASSIAHELNQPLSAISGYATGLSNYIQKDAQVLSRERLIDVTEKIRRQAERAAHVTRRVQQFAKQQSIAPVHIEVPELIEQVIEFMELELRQKRCSVVNHSKGQVLPQVYIDNTMAQQILINIIRNAIDAMVDYNVADKRIDIHVGVYSNHHLVISLFDTGPGVPEEHLETIFNAFYTTKVQGIGIGLNICRTMIESNGGRLWAKAEGKGGAFYLTIPISQI